MSDRNIKLTIQYDGTAYHGWQSQRNADTVQERIVEAIERLTLCKVRLFGSSRTDAGVHAMGQVAHFHIDCPVPTENFRRALNRILPDDIVITEVCDVAPEFDAIKDTRSKRYRYSLFTGPVVPDLLISRLGRLPTSVVMVT